MDSSSEKLHSLTPERLALIKSRLGAAGLTPSASERVSRRHGDGPAALSFAQERLWFLSRMAPESPVFNIPAAFRITGPLRTDTLVGALGEIHARHEALRTSFGLVDGRPAQSVAPAVEPEIDVVDLTSWAPDAGAASDGRREREEEALRRARVEARRPFDLGRAPLARFALYRLDDDDHLLLVSIHHIVAEVQSLGVVLRELGALYRALEAGQPSPLAEPAVHFADFAVWQRERMSGARHDEMLAYWKHRLGGALPNLQLPTDRPRPAIQSFAGGTRTRALPRALSDRLRSLCREERSTPFVAGLALYSTLLSRYAGQDDVLIGVPMTDRNRVELEGVIGFFVNTLVFRCDLAGKPGFRELLRRTQETFLGAQSNQELPFEHLVQSLEIERDLSRSPVFQVAFLFQNLSESQADDPELAPGLAVRALDPLAMHTGTSKFDASLVMWDDGEDLSLSFEYATELFDAATIDRMLAHLERLLEGALAEPDRPVSTLAMLTADEQRELDAWNDTAADIPERCVHELFEEQVDRTPDAIAVVAPGPAGSGDAATLTYRELDERANRLAHRLRALGVGPGELVAICTERAPEMVVGILGTLKAGGAYVPLDLALPPRRLGYMIGDADVRVVLTRAAFAESLSEEALGELDVPVLVLDAEWESIATESAERPAPSARPRDLAYVIYTSGSTGRPKGVELEHLGLVNLLTWHRRAYVVRPEDRATHLAGLAFDASVWEVWPYLTAGSSLFLVDDEVRLAPAKLVRFFEEHRITQSFVPTPLAEATLREQIPDDLPLEVMLTGGDKLHRAPLSELPFRLFNQYGPTENTVVATATEVPPDPDDDSAPPIGRPIQNVRCHLLDRAGQPVPVGVPGELFIGGRSLARGYRGRPDMTAEKFVADPFVAPESKGARLYATGDLARWRPDGRIDFLGRLDSQVKVRGFRIELGEIEAVLGQHPAVAECAVVIREETPGEGMLVGYTVAKDGEDASSDELRGHLRQSLPEYMVPAVFVSLDAMPLTANGKIDRRALPEPDRIAPAGIRPPTGELEELIAGIWCEALERDAVGADTNFFDLGGHSLLMARVHARLQEAIDGDLSIVALFQYPTVGSLAAHLADLANAGAETALASSRTRGASRRAAMERRKHARGRG